MLKTNISRSPLLRPVIERDYTRGITVNESGVASTVNPPPEEPEKPQKTNEPGAAKEAPPQRPGVGSSFNMKDETTEFKFNDIPTMEEEAPAGGEGGPAGVQLSAMSAKAFAAFAANAIKVYVPKLTGNICKIDIEDVAYNIQKGKLPETMMPYFQGMNERTEEALKIPDDSLKMWRDACQAWLEYKQFSFANPETAFIAASIALAGEISVSVYQCQKANKDLYKKALEDYNPGTFNINREKEPVKEPANGKFDEGKKAA